MMITRLMPAVYGHCLLKEYLVKHVVRPVQPAGAPLVPVFWLWADGHVPLGEDGSASDTPVADRAHCADHRLSAAVHVWRVGDVCASKGALATRNCLVSALPMAALSMLMHLCMHFASAFRSKPDTSTLIRNGSAQREHMAASHTDTGQKHTVGSMSQAMRALC